MNTPPANLNPMSAVKTQAATGKQQESEAETAFSQVLSSEIAQNRRGSEAAKGEKTDPGSEETAEAVDPATANPNLAVKTDNVQIAAGFDMLRPDAVSVSAENVLTLATPSSQAQFEMSQTTPPEALIALATPSSQVQSGSRPLDEVTSEGTTVQIGNLQIGHDSKKGTSKSLQAAQLGNIAAGAQKPDTAQPAKADARFIGQLAAARQSDSTKAGDPLSDLMANSIMRATPQASIEAPTPTSGASANRLAPSVGTAAWGQALGEKVVWMAAGAQQTASLTLNPPNLGPLQVVLNISNEQATASFFSAQPEVRQALEAAFPRLREMMNDAGIQLGQATVSADTPQQQAFEQRPQQATPSFSGGNEPASGVLQTVQSTAPRSGRGLVDTFA